MPKMTRQTAQVCVLLVCVLGAACTPESGRSEADSEQTHEHEHSVEGHLPFDSLVAEIREHRDAVKAAFDADKQDDAHDPLHQIGHLIAQLPDAAAETDLAESDWNEVKQASDKLMAAFGKVDALFHGDKDGLKFAEIEQDVQEAIAVLEAKVAIISHASKESQP
jgi:hypothetical protein